MRNLRPLAIVATLALTATSCGSDGEAASDVDAVDAETVTETLDILEIEFEQEAIDAAVALIERLGMPEAVDAFILAVDAGYTADQLLRAASDGSLQSDGTIQAADGGTASPQGEPAGMVDRGIVDESAMATYQAVLAVAAELDVSVESIREAGMARVEQQLDQGLVNPSLRPYVADRSTYIGAAVLAKMLRLLSMGFSAEDVIAFLVLRARVNVNQRVCGNRELEAGCEDEFRCAVMVFPDGSDISVGPKCGTTESSTRPATTTEPSTTTRPAPTTPEVDRGLVFRGPVDVNLVFEDTDGLDPKWDTNRCATTAEATLTLRPDGTASLVTDWLEFVAAPGSGVFTGSDEGCMPNPTANMRSRVIEGTWEDEFFSVGITEPYGRSISPVEGDFGEDFAAAAGSLTLESAASGLPITGTFSFNLTKVGD